ncbi:hypothetical protein D9757_014403 [Collybiopsis confluens]|uniref:CCHC-type domain-containing protein n=1 Tax=Collybiopsis confluens TaxID=2823264 RepID=A0A8H5LKY3_9AGAR|nr:hypothetical protein D9757_014403 [Collybiopsis confluens]
MSSNPSALPNLITFPEDKQLVGLSNWAVFRDHVQSVARSAGLNGYLNGTITAPIPVATASNIAPVVTPVNSRTPTPEEWELHDTCLAGIVFQNIKDPRSIGVTQDMTSNVMWIASTGKYKNSSAAAQTLATEQIQQYKYTAGTAFEDYFKGLGSLRKSANDVGCNITNDDLRSRFFTSLPRDYLWILQNHGACSFPDLKKHLIEYDMMVESVNHIAESTTVPNTLVSLAQSSIICDNCKRTGHVKKNCWAHGGGSEGKAPCWYRALKGMEPSAASTFPSDNTSTVSAIATAVTSAPVTAAAAVYDFSNAKPEGMGESLHHHSPPDVLVYRLEPEAIVLVNMSESGVCSTPSYVPSVGSYNMNGTPTFIDSGASHWCIQNRDRFVSYRQAQSTQTGRLATDGANGSFKIEGYGIAKIIVRTAEGSVNRLRFPASHTPTFGMNLLSLPAMDRKGFRGVWGNGKIEVQDPASMKVIVDGMLAGRRGGHGLYQVQVVDSVDKPPTYASKVHCSDLHQAIDGSYALATSGRSRSKPCSLKMWHTRFGHANINLIRLMAKQEIVTDFPIIIYDCHYSLLYCHLLILSFIFYLIHLINFI